MLEALVEIKFSFDSSLTKLHSENENDEKRSKSQKYI
tara:strand:- start:374 stop:484 length:111 start_codon:yes stop_codon:yes gene_type:complete